jgi:dephospho-CoA kinase
MLKLRKIAITGDIGSGKTTSCSILKELGGYIVIADELVGDLLTSNKECINQITAQFGQEIKVNNQINKKKLADIVFFDSKKLEDLEKILHPLVLEKINSLYKKVKKEKEYKFFVAEIPLLFEVHWESFFDETILLKCDKNKCKMRSQKNGLSESAFEARCKRFIPFKEKEKKASVVISNEGSVNLLEDQLKAFINRHIKKS